MIISAVILTKNEEDNIAECIGTLGFCSEIIVIDDYSTDKTTKIAKELGAKVVKRRLDGNYAEQRNYGLKIANSGWVLYIDADERVSNELKEEIISSINSVDAQAFRLKRQDYFLGRKLVFGETSKVKFIRLAKRSAGTWKRPVHETWNIKGQVVDMKEKLHHFPHKTIEKFIESINHYTTLEAQFRLLKSEKASLIELLTFPITKFVKNYFVLLGILDGFPGLAMAYFMSLHSLLLRVKIKTKKA